MRAVVFVLAGVCLAAGSARAADPPPLETWNQWEDSGRSGVARGMFLLGADVTFRLPRVPAGASRSLFVGIQLHGSTMITDRFGLRGDLTLHVHDGAEPEVRYLPATLGGTLHLLPRFPLDLYLGGRGGLAWLSIDDGDSELAPTVGVLGGLAFHYWGLFFLRAEAGYDIVRYGTQKLDGPCFSAGTGISF